MLVGSPAAGMHPSLTISLEAKPCGRTAVRLYNGVGEGESRFPCCIRERSSRFPLSFLSEAKNLLLAAMRFFGLRPQE